MASLESEDRRVEAVRKTIEHVRKNLTPDTEFPCILCKKSTPIQKGIHVRGEDFFSEAMVCSDPCKTKWYEKHPR